MGVRPCSGNSIHESFRNRRCLTVTELSFGLGNESFPTLFSWGDAVSGYISVKFLLGKSLARSGPARIHE